MVKEKKKKNARKKRSAAAMFASDSKYMKSTDVEHPVALTVERIAEERMTGESQHKPVCHWDDDDYKPLVVNKTNGRMMAELFGDDPDEWSGEEVELYLVDTQDREGNACKGIRIRAPKKSRRHDSADEEEEV